MTIPRVTVIVHAANGRIKSTLPCDVASGAIRHVCDSWGFDFLMLWLCRFCLYMAHENSSSNQAADLWIERYRKLRDVR